MAQGEGFKHITVTAAEEEDVVILAGAATAGDSEMPESFEAPAEALQVAEEPAPRPEGPTPRHPEGEARRASAKQATSERSKQKDGYHETTLEDLQDSPMPLTQKIVIVAAIVCIIGALIYYFAFMR